MSVYDRGLVWNQTKDESKTQIILIIYLEINSLGDQIKYEKMEECTFKPVVV